MNILVTGASGYVGRLLVPRLVALGHHVTCLVRNPERINLPTLEGVEIRQGNLLDVATVHPVMEGIDVAYYLVHSMADGVTGYIKRDHQAAFNFGLAAQEAGVSRIIYLGGLGQCEKSISPHLEARQHVGDVLRMFCVPVTEFRAAIVIGSGSMSFEMIRYLTDRLPILVTPKWISTLCQPIAIENVLEYLILSLDEPRSVGAIYEIGGPDVLTYEDIMRGYASSRKLRRRLVNLPFLTTRMLSLGADLITPLPPAYLHILIEGLSSEVVVHDPSAQEVFNIRLIPYAEAVEQALKRSGQGEAERFFAGGRFGLKPGRTHRMHEGMFIEQRRLETKAQPELVYHTFTGMGGKEGWYYANWLWRLRGWMDRLIGGVGMLRKRSNDVTLQVGDVMGGYTVEALEPNRMLRLRNDMKAPGPAWMQFEVLQGLNGKTLYIQTAFFEPHGLAGLAYWWALYPFHQLIFNGLAKAIVRRAERSTFNV